MRTPGSTPSRSHREMVAGWQSSSRAASARLSSMSPMASSRRKKAGAVAGG